jgi:hypothetical protein
MPRSSKSKASATGVAKSAKGQAKAASVGKRSSSTKGRRSPRSVMAARARRKGFKGRSY